MDTSVPMTILSPRDRGDQQPTLQLEQKSEPPLEVFCGRIPKNMTVGEIRELFARYGTITEMRMTTDPLTHLNKGFAFITFLKQEDALKAIAKVNGKQVRHRQYLKVTRCVPNTRLFVGNIPKVKGKEELYAEFALRTGGLKEVIIYKLPDDAKNNRGFCFLDYESHKAAANAKRNLSAQDIKIWGCDIVVDWADPQQEVDSDTMSKVRILHARNISVMVSEGELRSLFEEFGPLERVKKLKDFAFIHFASRDDASAAKEALQGFQLRNVGIELQWAKPPTDKETRQQILRAREKRLSAQQATRPLRGAVNPFPQPMGWDEDQDYFCPGLGGGDYQEQQWFWPPPQGQDHRDFFDNSAPYDYPLPRIPPSAFVLDGPDDGANFSGSIPPTWNRFPSGNVWWAAAERDENWRARQIPTIRPCCQWTNQNRGATTGQPPECEEENWRSRP